MYKDRVFIKVEQKPRLKFEEECEDNTKLAKCHLIVAAKLCNKSSDLARYMQNWKVIISLIFNVGYVAGVV